MFSCMVQYQYLLMTVLAPTKMIISKHSENDQKYDGTKDHRILSDLVTGRLITLPQASDFMWPSKMNVYLPNMNQTHIQFMIKMAIRMCYFKKSFQVVLNTSILLYKVERFCVDKFSQITKLVKISSLGKPHASSKDSCISSSM